MTKNISECDMFIKKYYDISWRYARYDLEYENKKKENQ